MYNERSWRPTKTAEKILEISMDDMDYIEIYRQTPELFDFKWMSFRDQLVLLEYNYKVFKKVFKFDLDKIDPQGVYELFLIDPQKYGRYINLDKVSNSNLERLIKRRPQLIKNLNLSFKKVTAEGWVILLRKDFGHYRPLFFKNFIYLKDKANLRRVLKKIPKLFKEITPEFVKCSCLNEKDVVLLLLGLGRYDRPIISGDLKKHLEDMSLLGILAGKFKKSALFVAALADLKNISTF